MGSYTSTFKTKHDKQRIHSTAASTVTPVTHRPVTTARCSEAYSIQNNLEHLTLAFFAGVLLTLLLLVLFFLIWKSYQKWKLSPKGHPHAQALEPQLDPHSEILAKTSSLQDSLTYANMTFKVSEKKNPYLTENRLAHSDSVVYSQIKEKN